MAKINKLQDKDKQTIYPITTTKAVYMKDNSTTLDKELDEAKRKSLKYEEDSQTLIYFNGEEWDKAYVDTGRGTSILGKDLVVAGVTIGSITPGTLFPKGTSTADILERILTNIIPPVYIAPTISITSSILSGEVGQLISPTITVRFEKNDAGDVKSYAIYDKSVKISDSKTVTVPNLVLLADKNYSTVVNYGDGLIKNNNVDVPDPIGQILAGSCTANVTIKAYRPFFGFASSNDTLPTSNFIRTQNKKGLNLNNGSTIQIVTEPNSKLVCFAYPATLRDCSKIRYEDLNDDNNKSIFKSIILPINDLTGNNPIDYRVYYYISPVEFGLNATFTLTV